MLITIISLFINFVFPILGEQLHDYMTNEEKELIFRVSHDQVNSLNYEVVPLMEKKNIDPRGLNGSQQANSTSQFEKYSLYLKIFGEDFDLYLEENNNVLFGDQTPIIEPYVGPDGEIKYDKRDYNLIPTLKMSAYHDRQKKAALTIYKDENGRINANGVINDTIIIRSIPKRLHDEVLDKNSNFSIRSSSNPAVEKHNHIVIKRHLQNERNSVRLKSTDWQSEKEDLLIRKPRHIFTTLWLPPKLPPLEYRDFTAYIKILIVLDYATYLLHQKNLVMCIRYTLAYWNVADLRFREMEKPHIRVKIAGVLIATKPNVIPYMEAHKASANSRYSEEALRAFEEFSSRENLTSIDYNIAVGMSPWHLVDRVSWWRSLYEWFTNTKSEGETYGIAHTATICKFPRQATALLRDTGVLSNGNIAAHEIAHILGVDHDPEDLVKADLDYKSHWKHGFMMSYATLNQNQMHWSDLSIHKMQKILQRSGNNHCLLNKPIVGTPYRKLLPGKILDRDKQCKNMMGKISFSARNASLLSDCLSHHCLSMKNLAFVKIDTPVAEGSFCGEKKICLEGVCVEDHTDPEVYQNLKKLELKN